MSFLDNLEDNLKALESQEQGGLDESKKRDAMRARALAAAPWAEKLKNGQYAKAMMQLATRAGYGRRVKVNLIWIDTTFRLEARGLKLELRPEAKGVAGVFLRGNEETRRVKIDLSGSPQKLVDEWMVMLDAHMAEEEKRNAALRAQALLDEENDEV